MSITSYWSLGSVSKHLFNDLIVNDITKALNTTQILGLISEARITALYGIKYYPEDATKDMWPKDIYFDMNLQLNRSRLSELSFRSIFKTFDRDGNPGRSQSTLIHRMIVDRLIGHKYHEYNVAGKFIHIYCFW